MLCGIARRAADAHQEKGHFLVVFEFIFLAVLVFFFLGLIFGSIFTVQQQSAAIV